MIGMENGIGQIAFDFPTKEIVERQLMNIPESEKAAIRTVPLSFRALVEPIENEVETENNQLNFAIDASRRKNQLLILDDRRGGKLDTSIISLTGMNAGKSIASGENPLRKIKNCQEAMHPVNFLFPRKCC